MAVGQDKDDKGHFQSKGTEPREFRGIRLTTSTWERLGEVAEEHDCSRADLIEEACTKGIWSEDYESGNSDSNEDVISQIEGLIEDILEDEEVTRKGKDKSACRRALLALLDHLQ